MSFFSHSRLHFLLSFVIGSPYIWTATLSTNDSLLLRILYCRCFFLLLSQLLLQSQLIIRMERKTSPSKQTL